MAEEKQNLRTEDLEKEPADDLAGLLGSEKKKQGNIFSPQLSYTDPKKSNLVTYLLLIIIVLLGLGAVGFFGWRYCKAGLTQCQFKNLVPQSANVNPVSVVSPTPLPTQMPKKTLDRVSISFEVLNGTAVAGGAKKVAEKLTGLGYTVVKVGNADNSTYNKNELFVRAEKGEQVDLLLADLKTDFQIASVSGVLKEGTASARLILGKEGL